MITRNKSAIIFAFIAFSMLFHASSCNSDLTDDPIPYLSFGSIYINLNLPEYSGLKTDGGFHYYDDGGVKGLIIYRQNASSYIVYERNCSYRPNEACAIVNVDVFRQFMEDPCCQSKFDFLSGNPVSGVAWRPLRKYFSAVTGTDLTITDEVIN